MRVVLDSYACLAYFAGEPAGDRVRRLFQEAAEGQADIALCTVNLGEVRYWTLRRGGPAASARVIERLRLLPIEIVPVDIALACRAGDLKARITVSYADCFAAALAQMRDAAVLTGDPDFERFANLIRVEWLPGR